MRACNIVFSFFFAILSLSVTLPDLYAGPWTHLQQGDKTAQEFLNQSSQKQKEAGNHPFYKGIPNESQLSPEQLQGRAQNVARTSPASQMVMESVKTRPEFKIDPSKDPLLTGSQKILKDPLKSIGGEDTREVVAPGKTADKTLTCEEARNPYPQTCTSEVIASIEKIKVKKEWVGKFHYWMDQGAIKNGVYLACQSLRYDMLPFRFHEHNGNITAAYKACMQERANKKRWGGCIELPSVDIPVNKIIEVKVTSTFTNKKGKKGRLRKCFNIDGDGLTHEDLSHKKSWYNHKAHIKIIYEKESHKELSDEEEIYCDELEKKVALGLCSYESKICSQGKQTRLIQGIPITRDCWQYTRTYACEYPSKDDCGPLRAQGCVQGKSACKTYVGKICVVHTQTYTCKANSQPKHSITGGQTPFCLDGNCRNQSWENNDEMMRSLAQLSILKEMQGQLQNGMIFKGEDRRCSRYILNFKDCCGSGKGWGKSIGLGGCSEGERTLNQKRQAGLCHSIGTYCAKKVLGKCIKKQSTFCCFNNKLLKAFHVQGRPQIKLGWGEPENPLCRGFTVDELQRIDFSKLDLREVFEDLMKKFQTGKNKSNASDMGKQIGNRMETIKKGLSPSGMVPPNQKQPKQRPEA
jgi:conjugal transfer mating pair stabilization protein TraN